MPFYLIVLFFFFIFSLIQTRYDVEESRLAAAQKAASAMAESYARPNMLMQHMKLSKEENNNGNE